MPNIGLKFIESTTFFNFQSYTFNHFYDIISLHIPTLGNKFYLHIQAVDYNGIHYEEWIVLYVTRAHIFTAIEELHLHLLNSINKHSKFNNDVFDTIIFEDGDSPLNDTTIKHINISYYKEI